MQRSESCLSLRLNFHNYKKDNPEKTKTKAAVVGCGIGSSPLSSRGKLNVTAPGRRCQPAPATEGCGTKCLGFLLLGWFPSAKAAAATCFPGLQAERAAARWRCSLPSSGQRSAGRGSCRVCMSLEPAPYEGRPSAQEYSCRSGFSSKLI